MTRKLPIWLTALALAGVACSGGGATGRKDQSAAPTVNITNSPTAGGSLTPSVSPSATATGPAANLPGKGKGGSGGGSGGVPVPTGFPIPNLFTSAENTIGIYPDRIVMCTHAALSLAAVF